jgi:hypothetical protein
MVDDRAGLQAKCARVQCTDLPIIGFLARVETQIRTPEADLQAHVECSESEIVEALMIEPETRYFEIS